ncbi:arginyl-tRNA synthetase [Panus rudis PR-1116 ss-1]|nr:arginyl-tRNA synthetase [Panus rudis PR-1116 ss-1]
MTSQPYLPNLLEKLPPLPQVAGTEPERSVLDLFRVAIAQVIVDGIPSLTVDQVYPGVDFGKKGNDFTVALPRFKLKGKPDVFGKQVLEKFQPNEWIESASNDGIFLHFQVRTSTLNRLVLNQIHELTYNTASKEPEYGKNDTGKGKKVVIEYSSPNIAKAFHVGHLRSTIIGAFLANLYKACGWDVVSINYLGDWGTQFGMISIGFEKYGSEEELQKDAIKHLFDVYVKINKDAESDPNVKVEAAKFFKRMEDGEEEALKNWRVWRELSIKKYAEEYDRLNVHFDEYLGESMVGKEWQDKALERLTEMNLIEDHEGMKLVNLEKWKMGKAVLRKKDGTSIYLTRDIGGAIERAEKYKFDKMLYVVSAQQDLHLAQFFKVLELMEFPWANRLEHINYGLVTGMSTRRGTVVFLDQIIQEATSVMLEKMNQNPDKMAEIEDPKYVAQEVGISGIKIQDMTAKRINNYAFNWNRMLSFEGDTGPYLQYQHARLSSIERKNPDLLPLPSPDQINTDLLTEPAAREIIFHLGTYPGVVKTAMEKHEPGTIVHFAFKLTHAISSAWEYVLVKGEPDKEKAKARMWMYLSARDVLGAAMRLLTLRPLERM